MDRPIILSENESKLCRICFDNENESDLISPCLCSGGSSYVHRKCLDNWRSLNKTGRAFEFCDVCQFKYVIEPVIDDPSADKKRLLIFRLLVSRDITLIILLIQSIIIGLAFLLQGADKTNHSIQNLYPLSMSSFGIYYLSSLILLLALLGVFGLIAFCAGLVNRNDVNRCDCACYPCLCVSSDCNGCNGNNNCSGDGASGILIVLVVIVVIFAIIGIFVGIFLSVIVIKKVIKRHTNKLWLRQETKKYIVKDFQGKRNELQNISSQHRNNNSITNRTQITPSAPLELLAITTLNTPEDGKMYQFSNNNSMGEKNKY